MKAEHVIGGLLVLGGAGAGIWWYLKQQVPEVPPEEGPPAPAGKRSGDLCGATLRFMHKGPAQTVWIGFGLGPGHQDPPTIPAEGWIGGWFDIPMHTELIPYPVDVSGIFPGLFTPGVKVDANKLIAPSGPPFSPSSYAGRYDDDWDDEVYLAGG